MSVLSIIVCLAWIVDGIAVQFGHNILFDYRAQKLYIVGHALRAVNLVCLLCVLYALLSLQSMDAVLGYLSGEYVWMVVVLYLSSMYTCVLFISQLCEEYQNNAELESECGVHRDVEIEVLDYVKLCARSLQTMCWFYLLVSMI